MGDGKEFKPIIESIDETSIDLIYSNYEEAKEIFSEEGYDVNQIEEQGAKFLNKLKFLSKAHQNQEKDQKLLAKAFDLIQQKIKENSELTGKLLFAHLQKSNPNVQYRKLEEWSDDEIREVLAETDLIKLIEKLDE